jgi:DNA-binding NarL/FixJ family response regulator
MAEPATERRGVMIADDHLLVRVGVRTLLDTSRRYRLVDEAIDVAGCLSRIGTVRPAVLLLDILLPDMSGIDAVSALRAASPVTRIVFLSSQESSETVMRALQTGAHGFLSKDFTLPEFELALDAVLSGRRYLSPRISQIVLTAMRRSGTGSAGSDGLTGRQREVLRRIAAGRSNKEIARELAISPKTVGFHREQLMQRLDLHDVASLTRYAVQEGLV